jgi:hypothetical protein
MSSPGVDDYQFGRIVVDGQTYTADIIIFPDHVQSDWWREEGHSLTVGDLGMVFIAKPSLLIIGLGASSRMHIPDETLEAIRNFGIQLTALPTREACALYNEVKDGEFVIAGLHLTC